MKIFILFLSLCFMFSSSAHTIDDARFAFLLKGKFNVIQVEFSTAMILSSLKTEHPDVNLNDLSEGNVKSYFKTYLIEKTQIKYNQLPITLEIKNIKIGIHATKVLILIDSFNYKTGILSLDISAFDRPQVQQNNRVQIIRPNIKKEKFELNITNNFKHTFDLSNITLLKVKSRLKKTI